MSTLCATSLGITFHSTVPGQVIGHTSDFRIGTQRVSLSVIVLVLGLVALMSVYYVWVGLQVLSAVSVSGLWYVNLV